MATNDLVAITVAVISGWMLSELLLLTVFRDSNRKTK